MGDGNCKQRLPAWIVQRLQIVSSFGAGIDALASFYRSMSAAADIGRVAAVVTDGTLAFSNNAATIV